MKTKFLLIILSAFILHGTVSAQIQSSGQVKTTSSGGKSPLASVFAGNDGGAYYVSEVEKYVYWFAEHPGKNYAHVFAGERSGNIITGKYWSVPKGKVTSKGTVKLKVLENGQLKVLQQTGGFPANYFSITTIKAIKDKLPGKKGPEFTQVGIKDLDGVFDEKSGYRLYTRQWNNTVVFFTEKNFSKGQQPAGAFVFIGSRQENIFKGHLIPVPKGKIQAPKQASQRALFEVQVKSDRTLKVLKDFKGIFGSYLLQPVLPDIKIPIESVMKILEVFEDELYVHLDGYDKNGNGLPNGSYISVFGKKSGAFTLPRHTINPKRWTYLNDVFSENVDFDALGGNKARIEIRFEEGGRELKRYCGSCCIRKLNGKDGQLCDDAMKDWDLDDIRITAELKLVNFDKGISYDITDFKWHAELDDTPHIDAVENWVSKKMKEAVETNARKELNSAANKKLVKDAICQGLKNLPEYLKKYKVSPYIISGLTPKSISVSGNYIVLSFKDSASSTELCF